MPALPPTSLPSRLLASTSASVLILLGVLASPALSADTIIANGSTVTQQLIVPGGTLTVQAGGVISDANSAVIDDNVPGSVTITNHGDILSTAATAVSTPNSYLALSNSGAISGVARGVYALSIDDLTNSGTISGFDGVTGGTITALTNTATGQIFGVAFGIDTLEAQLINNAGQITAAKGLNIQGLLGVLNNSGTITGTLMSAIEANAVGALTNSGTITGGVLSHGTLTSLTNTGAINGLTTGAVRAIQVGTVTNSGSITGATGIGGVTSIDEVNNSGTIVGSLVGINSGGTLGKLANSGTVNGLAEEAVYAIGNIDVIDNTSGGLISGGKSGIRSTAAIGTLSNAGTITGGANSVAVYSFGTLGTLSNSGTIQAGSAVFAQTSIDHVDNSGTIRGDLFGGVISGGALASLNNSGTISGALEDGVSAAGTIGSVSNSGTIRGGLVGVRGAGLLALTNSGTIAGGTPADYAIFESNPALATDTVLNLDAGSILIGHVDIHGGNNTLNVGPGLNLALTFDASVPETINTGNSAHVVVGNTVYVADPSILVRTVATTANLSQSIASAAGSALEKGFDEKGADGSANVWIEGLGSISTQPGTNGGATVRDGFAGFALGADFGPDADTRYGGFAGAARGIVDIGAQTSTSNTYYAGIYGGVQLPDVSLEGSLTAGAGMASGDRIVANNTVVTGLEQFASSGDSYFISPGVVLTKPWVTEELSFQTSIGLNYTGVFSAARSENAATGLSVNAATTHVFSATGLVTMPMQLQNETGVASGDIHAGLEGRASVNPDLIGTLAGSPITLASANVAATAGILAGGALRYQLDGGASLFSGVDATLRSDGSALLAGNVGFKASF